MGQVLRKRVGEEALSLIRVRSIQEMRGNGKRSELRKIPWVGIGHRGRRREAEKAGWKNEEEKDD